MTKQITEETKKPKAVIEKIDNFQIHLEGESMYYTVKTKEQAEKKAKEIEEEAIKEWEEENSEEFKQLEANKKLRRNVENLTEFYKKELRTLSRLSPKPTEQIETLKEVRNLLLDLLSGKKEVAWSQDYFGNRSIYSIKNVEEGAK